VTGRVTPKGTGRRVEPEPAAVRHRAWLLLPVIPVVVVTGLLAQLWLTTVLPSWAVHLVSAAFFVGWLGALAHAASATRPGWVVGMAVAPPGFLAYGLWLLFGLDRRPRPY
jgi:hypothetical protein